MEPSKGGASSLSAFGDSSVDQVVQHIRQGIIEGEYPHDTKLLPRAIAERCGTSFIPVREAMRILEAQGLVKSRTGPGGGTFVHEVSKERARALLGNYFYFQHLTIRDIYELRRVLEPELAAALATELIDRLRAIRRPDDPILANDLAFALTQRADGLCRESEPKLTSVGADQLAACHHPLD